MSASTPDPPYHLLFVCAHTQHGAHVETRGQLYGVGFLLPPYLSSRTDSGLHCPLVHRAIQLAPLYF